MRTRRAGGRCPRRRRCASRREGGGVALGYLNDRTEPLDNIDSYHRHGHDGLSLEVRGISAASEISEVCGAPVGSLGKGFKARFFDVPPEYIFYTRNGRIFSATTLNKQYRKALADCNLNTKMRFHDLRHSFATHLINSNVAVNTVSNMLGHSKTSTTLDIYVHADLASQSTAIKALESVLETAPKKA